MKVYKILFLMIVCISLIPAFSQEFPDPPSPPRLVNDFTGFLKPDEANFLERKLVEFNRETSTQIAIVIIPTLQGYDKADYSFRLAEKWGIGQKGKDNGILILVKPKTGSKRGEIFIAPGYGLEGAVPDAIAKRIIEVELKPNFKQGRNFEGLNEATSTLISLTRGEFTAEEYARAHKKKAGPQSGALFIFLLILFFGIFGRIMRTRQYSMGRNIPFWTAIFLASAASRSHRGHFNSFSSGSGGFGGGGFGGFGGGSFGGGGAGGSW